MKARPDDWASLRQPRQLLHGGGAISAAAVHQFEIAYKLEPRAIGPMVNAAIAYSNLGQNDKAEECLRRALKVEPANAAANFNLGLLLGEEGRCEEAEQALRAALKSRSADGRRGLQPGRDPGEEGRGRGGRVVPEGAGDAARATPSTPTPWRSSSGRKGTWRGQWTPCERRSSVIPPSWTRICCLAEIYEETRDLKAAEALYREALGKEGLSQEDRAVLRVKLRGLSGARQPGPEP